MAKIFLGRTVTDENGRATFTYIGKNAGLLNITAIANGVSSKPCKILDYDLKLITDVNVSNGVFSADSISPIDISNNTKFVVSINYESGILDVVKDNSDSDNIEEIITEIDIGDDGILVIKNVQDILGEIING